MTYPHAAKDYAFTTNRVFPGRAEDYKVPSFRIASNTRTGTRRGFMSARDKENWNQAVSLTKGLREALVRYADENSLLLKEVHAEALRDFIEKVRDEEVTTFRATVKSGTVTTIWGDRELLDEMRELAEKHRITYTAFVFNAFCLYLANKGYRYDA